MKEITKNILIGAAAGVICTAIVSFIGYLFLVKEHQIKIEYIEEKINEQNSLLKTSDSQLSALKLFVVSAHPNKNDISISSAHKLNQFDSQEMVMFASELSKLQESNLEQRAFKFSEEVELKLEKYEITDDDVEEYLKVLMSLNKQGK